MSDELSGKQSFDGAATERPILSRSFGIVRGRPRVVTNVLENKEAEHQTFYVEIDLSDVPLTPEGFKTRWAIVNEFQRQMRHELEKYQVPVQKSGVSSSSIVGLFAQTEEEKQKAGFIVMQPPPDCGAFVDFALQRILLSQSPQAPSPRY